MSNIYFLTEMFDDGDAVYPVRHIIIRAANEKAAKKIAIQDTDAMHWENAECEMVGWATGEKLDGIIGYAEIETEV